jgi:hypothetical protein
VSLPKIASGYATVTVAAVGAVIGEATPFLLHCGNGINLFLTESENRRKIFES